MHDRGSEPEKSGGSRFPPWCSRRAGDLQLASRRWKKSSPNGAGEKLSHLVSHRRAAAELIRGSWQESAPLCVSALGLLCYAFVVVSCSCFFLLDVAFYLSSFFDFLLSDLLLSNDCRCLLLYIFVFYIAF